MGVTVKNGYFQLVCSGSGTALKVVEPKDGGSPVSVREIVEYLNLYGIAYDMSLLNKGLQDALSAKTGEYFFRLNQNPSAEIKESYRLHVSEDRMSAVVRLYPPSVHGARMTAADFLQDLSMKNITYGIHREALEELFADPVYCTDFVVAEGQEPRHGTDARIEYYFETDLKAKPTLNDDGSVDFFHLNTISHCSKGDVLARLFPADPGEYGRSVYDEKIRPREVKNTVLRYGRNIILSEDRQTLTSEVDGHVTLVEGKVFVSNVYEVENVDIATGDIDYEGSVKVNGNVCTNFTVRAKGNIEVTGIVEGAHLEAGGNIIIARGMNGMARGELKAKGNVIAKFIENAKVSAGGYVSAGSILHSHVMAGTEITVDGKRGFITGGRVSASHLIKVKTLGSAMGADTIVEVGIDPNIKTRFQELQKRLVENRKTLDKIQPVLTAMKQKILQGYRPSPDQLKNLQEMVTKGKQINEEIENDNGELASLQDMMDGSQDAKVEVTGEVFGGTKICISDVSMVVKNSMSYCKFVKDHGDVKMTAL